jgi:hypothetical protein
LIEENVHRDVMTNVPNSELPQQIHVLPHRVPAKCLKACSAYPTRVQVSVVVSETHEIFQIRVTSTISTKSFLHYTNSSYCKTEFKISGFLVESDHTRYGYVLLQSKSSVNTHGELFHIRVEVNLNTMDQ